MKGIDMKQWILGVFAALSMGLAFAAVNINTTGVEELKALPGIGPSKAAAIVAYRDQHGKFKSVDELKQVKGIGEGIYQKLKEEAVVGGVAVKGAAVPALKPKLK